METVYSLQDIKNRVLNGEFINKEEALFVSGQPLSEISAAADEIRKKFCGNGFDICTIINGKCGKCSEDCKYCAQSAFNHTVVEGYPLLDTEEIVKQAKYNDERGVLRFSIVTSGKKLSNAEVDQVCESIRKIRKETNLSVCVSFGLLNKEQFQKLKKAGVSRVHCNLEASRDFFQKICTTHTYDEKIATIKAAKEAGLGICSGGIMGLGETMEDRIDLALCVRELGVKSIPVNMLNPIKGTPYEDSEIMTNEELCRTIAVFRFVVPDASIRMAGGRGLLPDKGESAFRSGANAAISGDMLTTSGISIEQDMKIIESLGYEPRLWDR